jgi:hypothetical protein
MLRQTSLILLVLILSHSAFAQKRLWQKQLEEIRLLASTEAEVEKILGKAIERYAEIGKYETKDGRFTFYYSEGKCLPIMLKKYNVEKDVVIQYSFRPNKKIKFASLGIDVSDWNARVSKGVAGLLITYSNLDKGIEYHVNKGILNFILVYPANELDYLKCSK